MGTLAGLAAAALFVGAAPRVVATASAVEAVPNAGSARSPEARGVAPVSTVLAPAIAAVVTPSTATEEETRR